MLETDGRTVDRTLPSMHPNGEPPTTANDAALEPAAGSLRRGAGAQLKTAASALGQWWKAMSLRALAVSILWYIGLRLLHVNLAAAWALVAGAMTFIPHFGGVFSVMGPVFTVLVSGREMERLAYVLGVYAAIVVFDQLLLQPLLMKKVTRVPVWMSILAPVLLGILIPFWGVLLAPPLLAIVYAFRRPREQKS